MRSTLEPQPRDTDTVIGEGRLDRHPHDEWTMLSGQAVGNLIAARPKVAEAL
jgi:hypothetical protein